jgi:hypothetical protein
MIMAAFTIIAALVICGVLWWALQQLLALAAPYIGEPFMTLIRIVLVVILVCILLYVAYEIVVLLSGAVGGASSGSMKLPKFQ